MVLALVLLSRRLRGWLGHVRQGKQKLSPTHQFPERDKTRSKPINKKDHFFPRTDPNLSRHLALKWDTEAWKEIKDLEEVRKKQLSPIPHSSFQAISVPGIPFLRLPLRATPHIQWRKRNGCPEDVKLKNVKKGPGTQSRVSLSPQTLK